MLDFWKLETKLGRNPKIRRPKIGDRLENRRSEPITPPCVPEIAPCEPQIAPCDPQIEGCGPQLGVPEDVTLEIACRSLEIALYAFP